MKRLLLLLLTLMFCLTACGGQQTTHQTEEPTQTPEKSDETELTQEDSDEPELTQEEIVNYMSLTYVNDNPDAENYPVETEIVLPERTFLFEDTVSNPAEQLAYAYYYAYGTGDYEYLVNHTVGSNLKRTLQTHVNMESDGLFYEQVTLHEMEIVPIEDFFDFQYAFCEEVATFGGAYNFSEYTVVKTRASYRFNDRYREMDPNLEDDEVILYLFVGRTDGDYFLVELYGEDYVK